MRMSSGMGTMARYVWVINALSPRVGGWVRCFGQFRSEDLAWQRVEMFWDLMVLHGDYVTVEVVRTIVRRRRRCGSGSWRRWPTVTLD